MSAQQRGILRCEGCGHEWKSRRTEGKARQCSKCRSRSIYEVQADPSTCAESLPVGRSNGKLTERQSNAYPKVSINAFAEDPQVRKKRTELEIARLDRQIAEERGFLESTKVIDGLDRMVKGLIQELSDEGTLDSDVSDYYSHFCIWCGAEDDAGVQKSSRDGTWRCLTCGK